MLETHPLPCMEDEKTTLEEGCSLADSEWHHIFASLDQVGNEIMLLERKVLSPDHGERNTNPLGDFDSDQWSDCENRTDAIHNRGISDINAKLTEAADADFLKAQKKTPDNDQDEFEILKESSVSDEEVLTVSSVDSGADEKIYSKLADNMKQMDPESQRKKRYDNSASHQALLQSPPQFKNISNPQFSFSSVPPALPPKASSSVKLKPITINFEGGSRVALSHDSKTTSNSISFSENNSILASTAIRKSPAAPKYSSHVVSKISYVSSQPSDSSYFSLTTSSNLKPRPTFARDYFKSNGNNNNSGIPNHYEGVEGTEIQVPSGLVSSRVARFSQKVRPAVKSDDHSNRTTPGVNYTAKTASAARFVSINNAPSGNYESLNRTGPYDNVDLNMKYTDPNTLPPLPPKSYKSVKSSRTGTGTRVIPVSEGVTSPPPIFPRVPEKQAKISAERGRGRSPKVKQDAPVLSRSLSAPASPLLTRKFASGHSPVNGSSRKFKRYNSASSTTARSPSPTRSEIMPRARRSISVSSFSSDDVGMHKAPSIRSLRDRFGSQSSVGSCDTDQLEEDLRLIHEDSVKQRRMDQFTATREKQRLNKILTMCEKFVQKPEDENTVSRKNSDLSQLLMEISIIGEGQELSSQSATVSSPSENERHETPTGLPSFSPNIHSSMSNNDQSSHAQSRIFRRLASLERDICNQSLPTGRQGPTLPAKVNRSNNKSPLVSPKPIKGRPEDVAEIQQLYEQRLRKMEKLKQRISELETQLDECVSALEMEKALVAGELESEQEKLGEEEQICDQLKEQIIDLEESYIKQREIQNSLLEKEKKKLSELQEKLEESQRQLNNCPESIRDIWEEELKRDQTILEQDMRNFEDIEFQTLENISRMDEDKEMMQKKLLEDQRICDKSVKTRKQHVDALEKQMNELMKQEKENYQRLHSMRDHTIKELQEHREETSFLQRKYYELTGQKPPQPDLEASIRTKSQSTAIVKSDDKASPTKDISQQSSPPPRLSTSSQHSFQLLSPIDRQPSSPRSDDQAKRCRDDSVISYKPKPTYVNSYNFAYSTLTRYYSVRVKGVTGAIGAAEALTNSTHCVKPYFQKIQDSRLSDQKLEPLRGRGFDVMSLSSMDSLDTTTSAAWSHRTPDPKEMEKIRLIEQQLLQAKVERQRLLAEMNAYVNKSTQEMGNLDSDPSQQSTSSSNIDSNFPSSILSTPPSSSSQLGDISSDTVRRRDHNEPKKQTRPMTRYLPVRSKDFDLKEHIVSSGHNPDTCRHISVTSTTCRGYLMKMGGRIRTWKKRWFVLDRQKKIISYFHNKHETKLRGMIYFQAIEDVFFDHLKLHRTPNPTLTFCVKCYDRTYSLVAPSAEALRIWMDVIVTAAEGYTEYMKTME